MTPWHEGEKEASIKRAGKRRRNILAQARREPRRSRRGNLGEASVESFEFHVTRAADKNKRKEMERVVLHAPD